MSEEEIKNSEAESDEIKEENSVSSAAPAQDASPESQADEEAAEKEVDPDAPLEKKDVTLGSGGITALKVADSGDEDLLGVGSSGDSAIDEMPLEDLDADAIISTLSEQVGYVPPEDGELDIPLDELEESSPDDTPANESQESEDTGPEEWESTLEPESRPNASYLFDAEKKSSDSELLTSLLTSLTILEASASESAINEITDISLDPQVEQFIDVSLISKMKVPKEKISASIVFVMNTKLNYLQLQKLAMICAKTPNSAVLPLNMDRKRLVQFLNLRLHYTNMPGLTLLLDRNSIIVGEKFTNAESIGTMLDTLVAYMESRYKDLAQKSTDIRYLITSILYDGLEEAQQDKNTKAVVDVHFSLSKNTISFATRYKCPEVDPEKFAESTFLAKKLSWHLAWKRANLFCVNYYSKFKEVEVKFVIDTTRPVNELRKAAIFNSSDIDDTASKLAIAPEKYQYKPLSKIFEEVEGKKKDQGKTGGLSMSNSTSKGLDVDAINGIIQKKNKQVTDIQKRANDERVEFNKKQEKAAGLIREAKTQFAEVLKEKTELERKIKALEIQVQKNSDQTVGEIPYDELKENADRSAKEVDLLKQQLKTMAEKVKSGGVVTKAMESSSESADVSKLKKELLASTNKEQQLAKVVKQMTLKSEQAEKMLTAVRQESAEKVKKVDRQLQELKKREVDYKKKIEELTKAAKGKAA